MTSRGTHTLATTELQYINIILCSLNIFDIHNSKVARYLLTIGVNTQCKLQQNICVDIIKCTSNHLATEVIKL